MAIPLLVVRPAEIGAIQPIGGAGAVPAAGAGFGDMLRQAIEGTVAAAHDAEAKSAQAIAGSGDLTDVVTAVAKAELTLQTAMTIRDRMVQAYQDILRMAI